MLITATYAGRCRICRAMFPAGSRVRTHADRDGACHVGCGGWRAARLEAVRGEPREGCGRNVIEYRDAPETVYLKRRRAGFDDGSGPYDVVVGYHHLPLRHVDV